MTSVGMPHAIAKAEKISRDRYEMHGIHSLIFAGSFLGVSICASAAEYMGHVTFQGEPVPGATVTVTKGDRVLATVSDRDGVYRFNDLEDGQWKLVIRMQCFVPLEDQVTITANAPTGSWGLKLLPADQLFASLKPAIPQTVVPVPSADKENTRKSLLLLKSAKPTNVPPEEESDNSSTDGLLINGSVNNAATTPFSTRAAFGNTRPGSGRFYMYNGSLSLVLDDSALDARPYAISGYEAPKEDYNHLIGGFTFGGPLRIPYTNWHAPNLFMSYSGTRSNNAAIVTGLVPTDEERKGNLAGLVDAQGRPVIIYDRNGSPSPGNRVSVSPQAKALLQLYPTSNIPGAVSYNYQAAVLNSTHQDSFQLRLSKGFGASYRNQLSGGFNSQSARTDNVNFFGFVDTTDTLNIRSNINWSYRFRSNLNFEAGYNFSRTRTLVIPNFKNRTNISGAAQIAGNNQDATNWGPPTLIFSSGIASLSDANSSFNRNRSDEISASVHWSRPRHILTVGGILRKQDVNDNFQQNPRGAFTFTGAATQASINGAPMGGSDLADFLIGAPDTSVIAYGNADKYFRQPVYSAFANDDWRIFSALTINVGMRWEYEAPITELHGRLVNLDVASQFSGVEPVLGSNPVGTLTGERYPASLMRPDRSGIEPRVGISWRPIPASSMLVRAGYGIYRDASVYQNIVLQLAQQAPLSQSVSAANSADCPLTLAHGFPLQQGGAAPCASAANDSYGVDSHFRAGYAQIWQLTAQRDLPFALQVVATYNGIKGTHGAQQFLPNTYPIGGTNPCPECPSGFLYQTSGGNSTRESGQLQLRRRLRSGIAASLLYTYSKSIDDDAYLGGAGRGVTSESSQSMPAVAASVAQNWLDPRAERSLSSFDQRHLLNVQAQYSSGEGLRGGTLMGGWRGRVLKEWTLGTNIGCGMGLPETPLYPAVVPGTSFTNAMRPDLTGAPLYKTSGDAHLNVAAYAAPIPGQWGTAGRNSITGPAQFSLDGSLARTFRPHGNSSLDLRIDSTNLLNHGMFASWNTTVNSVQFGLPSSANAMRSLQSTIRLRF